MSLLRHLTSLSLAAACLLAAPAPSFAWEMPGAEDAQTTQVKAQAKLLIVRTYHATVAMLTSAQALEAAAGRKAQAEQINSVLNQLKNSKPEDPQSLKVIAEDVKAIGAGVAKAEAKASKLGAAEKTLLVQGLLQAGTAGLLDALALKEAKDLADQTQGLISAAASNPMKLAALKDVADTATFVVNFVPSQAQAVKGIGDNLGKYAKSNGLALPSAAEIQKAADAMQKQ